MNLADVCQGILNILNFSTGGLWEFLAGQMGKFHFWGSAALIVMRGIAYRIYRIRIQGADDEIRVKNDIR